MNAIKGRLFAVLAPFILVVAVGTSAAPPTNPASVGQFVKPTTALQTPSKVAPPNFIAFESGHVRPLAIAGNKLLAVNTPDNRLEIFEIEDTTGRLRSSGRFSVPVGMEPVAVAVLDEEAWVVNHLSDSISIVDLSAPQPYVVRTLLVGDEPRDIVFAGADRDHAYITTAHRGQHRRHPSIASQPNSGDPQLLTPDIGRADIWVFDSQDLDQGASSPTLGGVPVGIIELFGDTPRALAVSPDGESVYAAIFHSGNRTTIVHEEAVMNGFGGAAPASIPDFTGTLPDGFIDLPGGLPDPSVNAGTPSLQAPETGIIVQFDPAAGIWVDEQGRDWSDAVRFELPDYDVFEIDASPIGLSSLSVLNKHAGVGTILFNMVVGPDGTLFVSNTEANNLVRFEGEGISSGKTPPSVQGHTHETRITVIEGSAVKPRHINRHIDYSCTPVTSACAPTPPAGSPSWYNGVREHSLATPMQMIIDGETLYMAAFGSNKVGVFDTTVLRNDSQWATPYPAGFNPTSASSGYIDVTGGGPSGLVLGRFPAGPDTGLLYVMTRFDNGISVIDLSSNTEIQHTNMYSPEPSHVVEGRPFLYDAVVSSSNGENSCGSCHVFGQYDSLAWDLGDPDADAPDSNIPLVNGTGPALEFHPMKGPMTTQTLRGMVNHGAMHWRGDRAIGFFGSDPFDTTLSFKNFLPAFEGLLGLESQFDIAKMEDFTEFALGLTMPPNPIRSLDNSLTTQEALGSDLYQGTDDAGNFRPTDGVTCNFCHALSPVDGFFGTEGKTSFEGLPQIFKVPQLRNMYQKVGMFGLFQVPVMFQDMPVDDMGNPLSPIVTSEPMGPQIRGFGYLHDGSVDNLLRFFHGNAFAFSVDPSGTILGLETVEEREAMTRYMLAFDNDLAPMVGQQVTFDALNGAATVPRLIQFNNAVSSSFDSKILGGTVLGECEVIVKGIVGGQSRGAWLDPSIPPSGARFLADDGTYHTDETILNVGIAGQEVTYTCVPPGSGKRMGIDRDSDGCLDLNDPQPADPTVSCP